MSDITLALECMGRGEADAAQDLLRLVYGELHRMAAAKMAHEMSGVAELLQAHGATADFLEEPAGRVRPRCHSPHSLR